MEKCRHCGADRQEEHIYCPVCGEKLVFTRSDFWLAERNTMDIYTKNCVATKELPPDISRRLAWACWDYADFKYGNLRQFSGKDKLQELPKESLEALTLVRNKAEELFGLILEY